MATNFYGCHQHDSRKLELSHSQVEGWDPGPLMMTRSSSSRPTFSAQPHSEVCPDDMFNCLTSIFYQRRWYRHDAMQLRHASPEAKIELDNVSLFASTFKFSCPMLLSHFLNSLSARQINLLRSIELELFDCQLCSDCCLYLCIPCRGVYKSSSKAWIASIERLPATIQSVTFKFGQNQTSLADPLSGLLCCVDKVLALLELVTKRTRRLAPNAKISIGDLHDRRGEDSQILQDVLDEVDEYSEDYKRWWRESCEKTMSQSEET